MDLQTVRFSTFNSTSGLGSSTQVISGTAVCVAGAESNFTPANPPRLVEFLVIPTEIAPFVQKDQPRFQRAGAFEHRSTKKRTGAKSFRNVGRNPKSEEPEKVLFQAVASRLIESTDPAEQEKVKKQLARMTFGE